MKKTLLVSGLLLTMAVFAFGQNLKDYRLVSYYHAEIKGAVPNVEQPKITKYAIAEKDTRRPQKENDNLYTCWISTYSDGLIIIEMNAVQAQEVITIAEAKDRPLILITRINKKTTYKSSIGDLTVPYRSVVDRIIPLKEVYGVPEPQLPKKLWLKSSQADEIIHLYLQTGKTDPDGRVARELEKQL